MKLMKLDHCPSCGAKTVWVEHSTDTEWIFAAACPKCLLHMKISNGNVELTRPESEKERPELRKPREWTVAVSPDLNITSYRPKEAKESFSWELIRVREVIEE